MEVNKRNGSVQLITMAGGRRFPITITENPNGVIIEVENINLVSIAGYKIIKKESKSLQGAINCVQEGDQVSGD